MATGGAGTGWDGAGGALLAKPEPRGKEEGRTRLAKDDEDRCFVTEAEYDEIGEGASAR